MSNSFPASLIVFHIEIIIGQKRTQKVLCFFETLNTSGLPWKRSHSRFGKTWTRWQHWYFWPFIGIFLLVFSQLSIARWRRRNPTKGWKFDHLHSSAGGSLASSYCSIVGSRYKADPVILGEWGASLLQSVWSPPWGRTLICLQHSHIQGKADTGVNTFPSKQVRQRKHRFWLFRWKLAKGSH